jgi:hypothetical protein
MCFFKNTNGYIVVVLPLTETGLFGSLSEYSGFISDRVYVFFAGSGEMKMTFYYLMLIICI